MNDRGQEITESRAPSSIPVGAWTACLRTEDRITWRSTDGVWQAQLQGSNNGGHVSLAYFCREVYLGRFDDRGWHAVRARRRPRQPRTLIRSLALPLAS